MNTSELLHGTTLVHSTMVSKVSVPFSSQLHSLSQGEFDFWLDALNLKTSKLRNDTKLLLTDLLTFSFVLPSPFPLYFLSKSTQSSTELVGLAAAETGNPRKEVPKASKQIFWRIIIFYVLSLFMVTLIVPYDNPDLLGGSYDANASPFVVAIRIGGIKALPSVMNAVILVSVLSVGNSAVYAGSRTMNVSRPRWIPNRLSLSWNLSIDEYFLLLTSILLKHEKREWLWQESPQRSLASSTRKVVQLLQSSCPCLSDFWVS